MGGKRAGEVVWMLRRQPFGGNRKERISTAEVPDEEKHCTSLVFLIFRDWRDSLAMVTSLHVQTDKVHCLELI